MLFMEFWLEYWMETQEWWQVNIRAKEHYMRMSIYNYQSLSRDGMYELVQNRMDYDPSEIIDWSWLDDWNSRQMWKRGFIPLQTSQCFVQGFIQQSLGNII